MQERNIKGMGQLTFYAYAQLIKLLSCSIVGN